MGILEGKSIVIPGRMPSPATRSEQVVQSAGRGMTLRDFQEIRWVRLYETQQLGPKHPETAQGLNNLADLYREQGKYEQAEPLYERALAIREEVLGPEHPETAQGLN